MTGEVNLLDELCKIWTLKYNKPENNFFLNEIHINYKKLEYIYKWTHDRWSKFAWWVVQNLNPKIQ